MAVSAGYEHSLAVRLDGTVWAWGENRDGQLGDGSTIERCSPVQVQGLTGIIAVSAGYDSAWRSRAMGRSGRGETTAPANWATGPLKIARRRFRSPGLAGVTAVAAGSSHSLALKSDGTVRAWGHNYYGQLGDLTTSYRTAPVPVVDLSGVIAIAAGYSHSLALEERWNRVGLGSEPLGAVGGTGA